MVTSGKTTKKCLVTKKCWDRMTSGGYRGYSLTHQVFYIEIGRQVCMREGHWMDTIICCFLAN